jgi:ABC-type Na+ efflux pump permease subunit
MAVLVVLSVFLANAGYSVVTISPLVHLSIVSRRVGAVSLSGSQDLARSMLIWIGILPLLFSAQQAAITVAGERERRSLTALLASPVPTSSILLGKLAGSLAPGLVMLGVAYGLYFGRVAASPAGGASWLPAPYVAAIVLLVLVFSLLMNSLALIVSSLAPTVAASSITATFVLLPITMVLALVSVEVGDLGAGGLLAVTSAAAAGTCAVLAYAVRTLCRERLLTV